MVLLQIVYHSVYSRIQEKLKEIRQDFSKAVTSGSRSGSGKIVLQFYDQLVQIWGGSPATEPLAFGTSTDGMNNATNPEAPPSSEEEDCDDNILPIRKRTSSENPVPKLIDNKRKHVERQHSASQCDQILINESTETQLKKKDVAEAIRQANDTFGQCMQQMSMYILQVAQGLTRSVAMMSQAMVGQNTPYQYTNQVASNSFNQLSTPYHINRMQYSNLPVAAASYAHPLQTVRPPSNKELSNNEVLETIDASCIHQLEPLE